MPTGAFNICCPRDAVSRTANVERTGGHKNELNETELNEIYPNVNINAFYYLTMYCAAIVL